VVALGQSDMGEKYGASAAPSPRAAVVMLHRSMGRDRALVPQLCRATERAIRKRHDNMYKYTLAISNVASFASRHGKASATWPSARAKRDLWRPWVHASVVSLG